MSIVTLNGATRVVAIVGDPIAQVKSPAGVTQALNDAGCNAVVVPMHVTANDIAAFLAGFGLARNVDGLIATVPHKFTAFRHCASTTDRARFVGAANILRRDGAGGWHGDMTDGEGFVAAARREGCAFEGAHALLVGAGGAGSAIGYAMLQAGVARLVVHDVDRTRRDGLVARLAGLGRAKVAAGSGDPAGCSIVVNATPTGMRPGDPLPVDAAGLDPAMFVADVVTAPPVTPLVERARALGCRTQTGGGMFAAVCERMVAFLLETGPLAEARRAGAAR